MKRLLFVAVAAAYLAACSSRKPQEVDAGPADAGAPALAQKPPPPAELEIKLSATYADGHAAPLNFDSTARPSIDPPTGMTVTMNLPLRDYRIRVFDEADKVVPSRDTPKDLDYQITFDQPLTPGSKYALLVDSQSGGSLTDANGKNHPDLRREFTTTGEKPKAANGKKPADKSKKKKKK